mmetsp:Transcript_99920/g.322084  ORF Transcript_99920/g.322084 Transcript_99920/m.322084 type:complete len:103 (+) Transcript_99920:123-431(+)
MEICTYVWPACIVNEVSILGGWGVLVQVQRISGAGGYGLPNRLLNVTLVMEVVFSLFVMYSPFFQNLFHFATLPWYSLLVPIVTLVAIFGIEEFRKHKGWMF